MAPEKQVHQLPKSIDRYLATLSKLYAREGNRLHQEIIVNGQIRIVEGWDYDNWNGGTYGHALYLTLPEKIFLSIVKNTENLRTQLRDDLNKLHNVQNEHISEVFLELEASETGDWRQESGLLLSSVRVVSNDAEKRIWEDGQYRLFLSHKAEAKKEVGALKEILAAFGVSCFVAHSDIHPTRAWQDEIENALATMDGFVALMTAEFHDSDWTDQEVGYAVARGVRMMAVRLGRDPYGFIGKFQGITANWTNCYEEIIKILINDSRVFNSYITAIRKCGSWDEGNIMGVALAGIQRLEEAQITQLMDAYNETRELHGSWRFNGRRPYQFGPGLVHHLNRLSSREFEFSNFTIEEKIPF